jgi:hypothetical protein
MTRLRKAAGIGIKAAAHDAAVAAQSGHRHADPAARRAVRHGGANNQPEGNPDLKSNAAHGNSLPEGCTEVMAEAVASLLRQIRREIH